MKTCIIVLALAVFSIFSMYSMDLQLAMEAFVKESREAAQQEAQRRLTQENNEQIKAELKKKYAQSVAALQKSLEGTCTHYTLYLALGLPALLDGYKDALRVFNSKIEEFDSAYIAFSKVPGVKNNNRQEECVRDLQLTCYKKQEEMEKLEEQYNSNCQTLALETDLILSQKIGYLKPKVDGLLLEEGSRNTFTLA